jgi:hypothetical protein
MRIRPQTPKANLGSLRRENTYISLHHQYGKQKTFHPRPPIRPKKGVMSRCHANTPMGLRARQHVMVLKKIQERSATYLLHPKIVEPKSHQRQYRHPGTVLVI